MNLKDERRWAKELLEGGKGAVALFRDRFRLQLAEAQREATRRWPEVSGSSEDAFLHRMARSTARRFARLDEEEEAGRGQVSIQGLISRLHGADLFLVSAMETGSEAAWQAFRRTYRADLKATLRSFTRDRSLQPEVLDDLEGDLFGGGPDSRGLIASYEGTGPLGGWLRTLVFRRALAAARKRSSQPQPLAAEAIETTAGGSAPLESDSLEFASRDQVAELKTAVQQALAGLASGDRTLLLLRYMKGVTQKSLAGMKGWSEAKVSRRLNRIRKALLKDVRQRSGFSEADIKDLLPRSRESRQQMAADCFSKITGFPVKRPPGGCIDDVELTCRLGQRESSPTSMQGEQ